MSSSSSWAADVRPRPTKPSKMDQLSVLGKSGRQPSGTFNPLKAWKERVFIYLMNIFGPYLVTLKVIMCLNSIYLNSV